MEIDAKESERGIITIVCYKKINRNSVYCSLNIYIYIYRQKRHKREKNPGKIIMSWRCGCTMLLWALYLFFDILWPRFFAILINCNLYAFAKKNRSGTEKKLVFVVRSCLHIDALVVATTENAWHMHSRVYKFSL